MNLWTPQAVHAFQQGCLGTSVAYPCADAAVASGLHVRAVCAILNSGKRGFVALGVDDTWSVAGRASRGLEHTVLRDIEARVGPTPPAVTMHLLWGHPTPYSSAILIEVPDAPFEGLWFDRAEGDEALPWLPTKDRCVAVARSLMQSRRAAVAGVWSPETSALPVLLRHGDIPHGSPGAAARGAHLTLLGALVYGTPALLAAMPALGVDVRRHQFEQETVAAFGIPPSCERWSGTVADTMSRLCELASAWCCGLPRSTEVAAAIVEFGRNALSHRLLDALPVGEPTVALDVYPDAIIFGNRGDPPTSFVRIADERFETVHPRNPLLHAALDELGPALRGFDRAARACRASGLTVSLAADRHRTVVSVRRPAAQVMSVGERPTPSARSMPPRTLRERVARALTSRPQSARQVAAIVGVAPSTARSHLGALVAEGRAAATENQPNAPNQSYVAQTPPFFRVAQQPAADADRAPE